MAITKDTAISSIEVAGEFKIISVRITTIIKEDDVEISRTNTRTTYTPDTDTSTLEAEVAAVANVSWTDDVKNSFQEYLNSIPAPEQPAIPE